MRAGQWSHEISETNRGGRRKLGQPRMGRGLPDARYVTQYAAGLCKCLVTVMLLSTLAHAQENFSASHRVSFKPGSTTPQCMVDGDPDHLGFRDCKRLTTEFTRSYLERQDIIIATPPGYKRVPASKGFWAWQLTTFAFAVADEERTQHFFASPLCRESPASCKEMDPLLGRTRAQAYSVIIGLNALNSYVVWKMNEHAQERLALGLPPWRHGFWRYVYDPHVTDMLQIAWHLDGIFRTSHTIE